MDSAHDDGTIDAGTTDAETLERRPLMTVLTAPHAMVLLVAALIGRLPSAMAALAIVQLSARVDQPIVIGSIATAVYLVASAIGQPLLSRLVDRIGQALPIVASSVVAAVGYLVTALAMPTQPIVAIVAAGVAGFATPPLEPALRSLWPQMVPAGRALRSAYNVDAGGQELLFVLGPLLTVLGVGWLGGQGNLIATAAVGILGALLFIADPLPRAARGRRASDAPATAADGIRERLMTRGFVALLIAVFASSVLVGAFTITANVVEEQHGAAGAAGWIIAANGLGALVGATIVALRPLPPTTGLRVAAWAGIVGLGYLPNAVPGLPLWLIVGFGFVSGLALPPTLGQVFERAGILSPVRRLTEANGWVISAFSVGAGAGTVLGGVLADTAGTTAVTAIALTSGLGALGLVAVAAGVQRGTSRR